MTSVAAPNIRMLNPISSAEKRHIARPQGSDKLRRIIARQWELLPRSARDFLLAPAAAGRAAPAVDLRALARFWSAPPLCQYARGEMAAGCSGVSWILAHSYLQLGAQAEARALALNGAFLRECGVSSDIVRGARRGAQVATGRPPR